MINGSGIIAVWYQPTSSFAKWASRGVNTFIGVVNDTGPITVSSFLTSVNAQLDSKGNPCKAIIEGNYAATVGNDSRVLAYINTPDEPDGGGNTSPSVMMTNYTAIKSHTTKPVLLNLDGNTFPYLDPTQHIAYCAACDWVAQDTYPFNFGTGAAGIANIATRIQQLKSWSGGKPVICFIETSNQQLTLSAYGVANPLIAAQMRGPTTDEFTTEISTALTAGADAIAYFPDLIGAGWIAFDGTPTGAGSIENKMISLIPLLLNQVPLNPTISNVSYGNITLTSVNIAWLTNIASTSQVFYGITTNYDNKTSLVNSLSTSHAVQINNIQPGTLYHFAVGSTTDTGTSLSADFSFTTQSSTPPIIVPTSVAQTRQTVVSTIPFPTIPFDLAPELMQFMQQLATYAQNVFQALNLPTIPDRNLNYVYGFNSSDGNGWIGFKAGLATLSSGTATVVDSAVAGNTLILLTAQSPSASNAGELSVAAKNPGVSFVINSSNANDNRVIGYLIITPN